MKRIAIDNHRPVAPPLAPPKAPQGNKRVRILEAALKLFAHQPYQTVTMDRVADAADVAKGTLYLYFQSKEDLYLEILSDGLETIARTYQSSVDPQADVRQRLRSAIAISMQFYDQRRDLLRLMATEEPRMADARNRLIQQWRDRGARFFMSLIEEGVSAGLFRPSDPRLITISVLAGIRSLMLFYGANRPVTELSTEFAEYVIRGLTPDSTNHRRSLQSI